MRVRRGQVGESGFIFTRVIRVVSRGTRVAFGLGDLLLCQVRWIASRVLNRCSL